MDEVGRQHAGATPREFDREGDPVEQLADVSDDLRVDVGRRSRGRLEEPHGRPGRTILQAHGQRRDDDEVLVPEPQRPARRDEERESGQTDHAGESGGQPCHLFRVVQHDDPLHFRS